MIRATQQLQRPAIRIIQLSIGHSWSICPANSTISTFEMLRIRKRPHYAEDWVYLDLHDRLFDPISLYHKQPHKLICHIK